MGQSVIILFLFYFLPLQAQFKKTQYNFAQTYFGISAQYLPSTGYTYLLQPGGMKEKRNLPGVLEPGIEIGGLHFWGKADFYVSFPVKSFLLVKDHKAYYRFSTGISTGARFYPIKVTRNKIRPFVGINWSTPSYVQQTKDSAIGTQILKSVYMVEAGFRHTSKKYRLFDISVQYMPNHSFQYPLSRNQFEKINFPSLSFKIGYKFLFDFTQGNNMDYLDRFYTYLKEKKKISGFTIGIGPSSAFILSKSSYLTDERPFLQNPLPANIFADAGLGYYWHKPDIEFRISYRNIIQKQEAYNLEQSIKRRSIALEAFKFMFDYKGFVPFIGAGVSYEKLNYKEVDYGLETLNITKATITPVIVFGWDIRPSRAEVFVLRTNLRYSPTLNLQLKNKDLALDHLEINFIQLVLYPQRIIANNSFKKQIN
jgi:outer membrane protein W